MTEYAPNMAAPVDAPIMSLLHCMRPWRRATDARRYRDMKLHSILFGGSNPDQALRVAAGIPPKHASGGRWPWCDRRVSEAGSPHRGGEHGSGGAGQAQGAALQDSAQPSPGEIIKPGPQARN
jgi:hypothetical protein